MMMMRFSLKCWTLGSVSTACAGFALKDVNELYCGILSVKTSSSRFQIEIVLSQTSFVTDHNNTSYTGL